MDGGPVREFSTQSDILEQQAELLSWSFTNGRHTLSLQATYPHNQATAPLDIDYAIITTGDGNTSCVPFLSLLSGYPSLTLLTALFLVTSCWTTPQQTLHIPIALMLVSMI
jgi:hypothetical protein